MSLLEFIIKNISEKMITGVLETLVKETNDDINYEITFCSHYTVKNIKKISFQHNNNIFFIFLAQLCLILYYHISCIVL